MPHTVGGQRVRGRLLPRRAAAGRRGVAAVRALQARRPAGFRDRGADAAAATGDGEDRAAAGSSAHAPPPRAGPFGHHTHWTAPDHARPTGGDPAARVRERGRVAARARPRAALFCGGGWYIDAARRGRGRRARLRRLHGDARSGRRTSPRTRRASGSHSRGWLALADGRARCSSCPTTHSLGMLAAGSLGGCRAVVHVYFHDTICSTAGAPPRSASRLARARAAAGPPADLSSWPSRSRPTLPTISVRSRTSAPVGRTSWRPRRRRRALRRSSASSRSSPSTSRA